MKLDLPNLVEDRGRLYVRVMLNGRSRKIRLREEPGTTAFLTAYAKALEALKAAPRSDGAPRLRGVTHGSLGWLAAEYFNSAEFRGLDPRSQDDAGRGA